MSLDLTQAHLPEQVRRSPEGRVALRLELGPGEPRPQWVAVHSDASGVCLELLHDQVVEGWEQLCPTT